MSRLKRIKRRVLRQAVQENLDLIEGNFRPPRRSGSGLYALRSLAFVALPALLLASYLLATISEARFFPRWLQPANVTMTEENAAGGGLPRGSALPAAAGAGAAIPKAAPKPLSPQVFPLSLRRIVIDPGHGGDNVGTVGPGGVLEKELTLDISRRLEALLQRQAFEVELTRRSDRSVSLEDRALFANRIQGDIFVSVHVNWIDNRETRGIETYYLGPTDDPYLTELAASENQGSGYSLADFRRLLESVYANARQDESRRLASEVQKALHGSLRRISPDLQNRGVKMAPFVVLTGTEMPAILAEVSCLSNEEEARLLKLPEYRDYIAEALFQGIHTYSRQLTGSSQRGS